MRNREKYIENIEKIEELILRHNLSKTIYANLLEVKDEVQNFKILIPVVGGFNAGKTSLINSCFGTGFLTNILPETAIATEIRYGERERIIAYSKLKATVEYSISELEEIPVKEYTHLEVYLNNNKIKALGDIVIVDMPGLDSKIEEHNKAIFNYINEGVFYIVVADIDHGLKESILNFLGEVNMYNLDFAVILNKMDHKLPKDIEEVVENARVNVNMFAGKEVFVGRTSTKTNEISDFENILNNINIEQLIENKFKDKIILIVDKIIRELVIREKYSSVDATEIEKKILEIKNKIEEIEVKMIEEEQKIGEHLENEVKNNILKDLKQSLNSSIFTLVQASKSGSDVFTQTVNEIIRPILTVSANNNISYAFEEHFANMQKQSVAIFDVEKFVTEGGNKIIDAVLQTSNVINKGDISKKYMKASYETITGILAITTSVVAPWIEVVIFLLPQILQVLGVGSERNQDDKIKAKIENQVIPEIIMGLRPEISKHLALAKVDFVNNMRQAIEENKTQLIDSLQEALNEKQLKGIDFEKNKEQIKQVIKELETYKGERK